MMIIANQVISKMTTAVQKKSLVMLAVHLGASPLEEQLIKVAQPLTIALLLATITKDGSHSKPVTQPHHREQRQTYSNNL